MSWRPVDPTVVAELAREYGDANERYHQALAGAEAARQERDTVVTAFVEHGLLYREIGEIIGATVGQVSQMIARDGLIRWRNKKAEESRCRD